MDRLGDARAWMQSELPRLLGDYDIPGAVVAAMRDDEIIDVDGGVINTRVAIPTTTDSTFQVGCMTAVSLHAARRARATGSQSLV